MADAMGNDGEKRESIGQVMKIWSRRGGETRTPREEGDDEEGPRAWGPGARRDGLGWGLC